MTSLAGTDGCCVLNEHVSQRHFTQRNIRASSRSSNIAHARHRFQSGRLGICSPSSSLRRLIFVLRILEFCCGENPVQSCHQNQNTLKKADLRSLDPVVDLIKRKLLLLLLLWLVHLCSHPAAPVGSDVETQMQRLERPGLKWCRAPDGSSPSSQAAKQEQVLQKVGSELWA